MKMHVILNLNTLEIAYISAKSKTVAMCKAMTNWGLTDAKCLQYKGVVKI